MSQELILGFDPGRDKCGLAVMSVDGQLLYHEVVLADAAIATIIALRDRFAISRLVMGDRTTANSWKRKLSAELTPLSIVLVDEHNTTLEARELYWQMYPPKGFQRLMPQGLRLPPRPVDDIVAILLIQRYLQNR